MNKTIIILMLLTLILISACGIGVIEQPKEDVINCTGEDCETIGPLATTTSQINITIEEETK